ncbi:MAG: hypothetical protein AAGI34_01660 [Pseudomonadota bacterium]
MSGPKRTKGRASARSSSGALSILAAGFALSALLRAGDLVAALPAFAQDGFGNPVPERRIESPATPEAIGPERLIADLKAERARLQDRDRTLTERAQTLEALEERLRQRLDALTEAQSRLERTAVLVDDAAGKDVRHLASMYRQMKPKQAAGIFDRMTPSFAAGFLAEMPAEAAALIMANMQADNAYAVTLLLASRNVGRGE